MSNFELAKINESLQKINETLRSAISAAIPADDITADNHASIDNFYPTPNAANEVCEVIDQKLFVYDRSTLEWVHVYSTNWEVPLDEAILEFRSSGTPELLRKYFNTGDDCAFYDFYAKTEGLTVRETAYRCWHKGGTVAETEDSAFTNFYHNSDGLTAREAAYRAWHRGDTLAS